MTETSKALLTAIEGLLEQVTELQMKQTVQQSAFLALARQLAAQGGLDLDVLEHDLRTLGQADSHEGWREGHQALADAVRLVGGLPTARRK